MAAFEQTKLTNSSGNTIADTTCDTGPCTETSAQPWTVATNNGFGYNLTGNDIATDFTTSSYFRPFPDVSLAESPRPS